MKEFFNKGFEEEVKIGNRTVYLFLKYKKSTDVKVTSNYRSKILPWLVLAILSFIALISSVIFYFMIGVISF